MNVLSKEMRETERGSGLGTILLNEASIGHPSGDTR